MAESKSAKKNKKRRAGGKLSSQDKGSAGFEIEEDVSVAVVTPPPRPPPRPPSPDPIADLKRQIEDAKASKDHVKAQELRQKMWVLQDTLTLGKAGPGAPKVDIQDVLLAVKQPTERVAVTINPSSSDPTEKKLNKLHKKLSQIQVLKKKRDGGEKLEANQIDKIKTEPELLDEISILEGLLTGLL